MSYALARPGTAGRTGLLGMVIGLHIAVLLLLLAVKTIAPQIADTPLVVDFFPAAETPAPPTKQQAASQPAAPTRAPSPRPTPAATPTLASPMLATSSSAGAEATPSATPSALPSMAENKPPAAAPLTQARFDADYLKNPSPSYPPLSRRMGEEGKVILRVSVTPEGTAENIEIKTSSGSNRLDESASRTVRNWKFIPAKRADTPVQSWVLVPIIFKLEQ